MPESSAVVVPTTEGTPDMGQAAGVTKMKGGALVLTPLPLSGGRRKTRKISKKVLRTLKKMGTKKVMKMLRKGGQSEGEMVTEEPAPTTTGARRRRSSSRSRRGLFHY
jgi:alpha/beta superfamily hydrolase